MSQPRDAKLTTLSRVQATPTQIEELFQYLLSNDNASAAAIIQSKPELLFVVQQIKNSSSELVKCMPIDCIYGALGETKAELIEVALKSIQTINPDLRSTLLLQFKRGFLRGKFERVEKPGEYNFKLLASTLKGSCNDDVFRVQVSILTKSFEAKLNFVDYDKYYQEVVNDLFIKFPKQLSMTVYDEKLTQLYLPSFDGLSAIQEKKLINCFAKFIRTTDNSIPSHATSGMSMTTDFLKKTITISGNTRSQDYIKKIAATITFITLYNESKFFPENVTSIISSYVGFFAPKTCVPKKQKLGLWDDDSNIVTEQPDSTKQQLKSLTRMRDRD